MYKRELNRKTEYGQNGMEWNSAEQIHHCNFKVYYFGSAMSKKKNVIQVPSEKDGEKNVWAPATCACTTAHLMHSTGKMWISWRNSWESSGLADKEMESAVVKFEHGNGYEIKIIEFGEQNLCKRCYLAWNVYVITTRVQHIHT